MWMGGEMEMKQPGVSGNVAGEEGETDCHNTVKISDQRNLECTFFLKSEAIKTPNTS